MKKYHNALAALLMAISAFAIGAEPAKLAPSSPKALGVEGGRFVFGQVSESRLDRFMLDTKTGRLWTIVIVRYKTPEGIEREYEALQPIVYKDFNGITSADPISSTPK
ncbi:hypothetical protein INH39_25435 [Massilia violaceinigra]|uniref:Uncharacterized protein n=1 Tax=Massilia violaceinigra TaxID=2045208 RepID=A0ABY4A4Z6_9BURK|nr:hypothetical protein [Massilia violaceinigra]UOD28754.1 hypothetical protein INH39_25435 [Massilia violaceinigra]